MPPAAVVAVSSLRRRELRVTKNRGADCSCKREGKNESILFIERIVMLHLIGPRIEGDVANLRPRRTAQRKYWPERSQRRIEAIRSLLGHGSPILVPGTFFKILDRRSPTTVSPRREDIRARIHAGAYDMPRPTNMQPSQDARNGLQCE